MAILFAVLAAIALLCALGAFFQSLRAAFGAAQESSLRLATSDAHSAIVAEKDALLASIKDLAFDRAMDKLSEKDFEKLDKQFRDRARAALRLIDEDTAQHREQAKKLIDAHLSKAEIKPDAAPYRDAAAAARICAKCDTTNDVDARFCKRCAAPLEDVTRDEPKDANVVDTLDEPKNQNSIETLVEPRERARDANVVDTLDEPKEALFEALNSAGPVDESPEAKKAAAAVFDALKRPRDENVIDTLDEKDTARPAKKKEDQ